MQPVVTAFRITSIVNLSIQFQGQSVGILIKTSVTSRDVAVRDRERARERERERKRREIE